MHKVDQGTSSPFLVSFHALSGEWAKQLEANSKQDLLLQDKAKYKKKMPCK